METVAIDEVDPDEYDRHIHADRRVLTDRLNTNHLAIAYYRLAPGERFSGSVHAHMDQEEVFVVLEGEATFTVRQRSTDGEPPATRETVAVGPNEAVRFEPGEFQSGANESAREVVALALGAPRDSEEVRISSIPVLDRDVECPDCGHDNMRVSSDPDSELVCPECGGELRIGSADS
ncbi:cupin domain-containing protein [Natrononativus amylolyticus]|uniref:cupin domain-containing protein n=1 Tax=Natrononativus amylolyticus TaxID=2963434 RepID=UPI0020CF1550|nr:cupin domain-containing protein [Natrononativus amylolyticus]